MTKLSNKELDILKQVENITLTDYEINEENDVDTNNLLIALEELLDNYNYLKEKIREMEN